MKNNFVFYACLIAVYAYVCFACSNCEEEKVTRQRALRRESTQNTPYYQKQEIVVQVDPQEISTIGQVMSLATEMGFQYGGPVGPSNHYMFFRGAQEKSVPHDMASESAILWWQEQIPKERFTRRAGSVFNDYDDGDAVFEPDEDLSANDWEWPNDPLLFMQTHLVDPSDVPNGPGYSGSPININVLPVWMSGITGKGITIGIVDDGVEYNHPDLYANWNQAASFDFSFWDNSPLPFDYDSHGTSATGLAVATRDSDCGVGVAYGANFSALRILGGNPTDAIEASALCYKSVFDPSDPTSMVHIYSNSWGPSDDGVTPAKPGRLAKAAIEEGSTRGRNGKGSIYVWAAGNGRQNGDNIAWDGYASSRQVIPVGAVDEHGKIAYYSEPGAALLCVAPSSSRYAGITTTDLQGYSGDSINDCTSRFGGTSAASPMVAGVVALMLEANPELSWRDVKHILVHSSKPVDVETNRGEWQINAANIPHSHTYGFGVVDAEDAVNMAQQWEPVGAESELSSPQMHPNLEVQRASSSSKSYTVKSTSWFADYQEYDRRFYIEHVVLTARISTPRGHGMSALQLCSPWGTCSTLYGPGPGRKSSLSWSFTSVRHWGEDIIDRQREREMNNPTLEGKQRRQRGDKANEHKPNEWRIKVMNTETMPSDPVVLEQYRIFFYGVYI